MLESATLSLFRFYETQVTATVTGVLRHAMRTTDPSAAPLGNTSHSSTGDDVSNTVTPAAVPEALAPDVMSDETPATAVSGMASATAAALQRRG